MSNSLNQLRNVPVEKVRIVPGFNTRQMPAKAEDDPEIVGLANDIKENGLLNAIRVVPREDGAFDLIAGHRRMMAINYANEHLEAGIKSVQSIVTREMTDEQRDAYILADRFSAALKPLEAAEALKRFMDRGMSQTEVAKRFHLTVAYAGDLKILGNAPETVKEAVKQEVIAATEATRLVKEYGEDGAEIIAKDALQEAQATPVADTTTEASGEGTQDVTHEGSEPAPTATPALTKKRRGKAANDAVAKAKNVAPKRPKQAKREVPEGDGSEPEVTLQEFLDGTMIVIDRILGGIKVGNIEIKGDTAPFVSLAYKLRTFLAHGGDLNGDALSAITAQTPDTELEFMAEPQAEHKDAA